MFRPSNTYLCVFDIWAGILSVFVSAKARILNYYKHTLLTQVIKILPDDAFFDSLKCPENAPFCVQWKKNLGENQPFCCLLYLATAMSLYSDNFNYRYFVYFLWGLKPIYFISRKRMRWFQLLLSVVEDACSII